MGSAFVPSRNNAAGLVEGEKDGRGETNHVRAQMARDGERVQGRSAGTTSRGGV